MPKKYWLMKSEPENYSIDDLKRDGKCLWTGVRNYRARNFMTQEMSVGDEVIFYHSNAEPPAAVGVMRVSSGPQADPTALDKKSEYFEPKATREKPIWECVELRFEKKFARAVALAEIRDEKSLTNMALVQKGQRLSIQPVTEAEFKKILAMAAKK